MSLSFSDWPPRFRVDEQRFLVARNTVVSPSASVPTGFDVWIKPKWARMHQIVFCGSGGGGGAGKQGAAGIARSGGGGGGAGAGLLAHVPSLFLPDTLIIVNGVGGKGGVAAAGSSGGFSALATPQVDWLGSAGWLDDITGGQGGALGTNAGSDAGGAGGALGGIAWLRGITGVQSGSTFVWATTPGAASGAGGGAGAAGSFTSSSPLWSGCSGGGATAGGVSNVGGGAVNHPFPPQRFASRGNAAQSGEPQKFYGWDVAQMLLLGPPGGGGGSDLGVAGNGGDGYYGCGGAGGGGGNTAGNGGKGGDGFCIIWSW